MTSESTSSTPAPSSPAAAPPAPKPPPKPVREIPTAEQLASWVGGADLPLLAVLFDGVPVAKYDTYVMLIRKDELVPQHWQVLSATEVPEDADFDALPEVARMSRSERGRQQAEAFRVAWRELRGKRPALWTVPDLLAAIRRILEHQRAVDWSALLDGVRDAWRASDLPKAKEELGVLWNCLEVIRAKTK